MKLGEHSARLRTLILLTIAAAMQFAVADDVVLKPLNATGPEVAMVFIEGADIAPEQYVPLARAIQNSSNYSLWVGIPKFSFDTPNPLEIAECVNRIIGSMRGAGMDTMTVFFAAHSLGGIILQDYLFNNKEAVSAQVLMGAYLLRKYRTQTYPVPTLTIGGELDGLSRVTRIMESFYHRVLKASDRTKAVTNFPVVTVAGMSHMQFASGDPPPEVKAKDLRPEISEEQAHAEVASLVNTFISLQLGDSHSFSKLSKAVEATDTFMRPIVAAFELEGYHNFKPPCNSDPPSSACLVGSQWSCRAQEIMGGLKEARVNNTDQFHPVDQIDPDHLPHIGNNCSAPTPHCLLETETVTQNVYEELDKLDAALVPISASEMRVKMSSRQAIMEAAGYNNVDFNTSDGFSICSVINKASYNWALSNASNTTVARFQKFGEPYVMGEDEGPYDIGPLWIWDPLKYKKTTSSGNDAIEIRSPTLRTPLDFYIKVIAGFHYCKLLSPARAMEWVYVDGLRDHYSIR